MIVTTVIQFTYEEDDRRHLQNGTYYTYMYIVYTWVVMVV